MLGLTNSPTFGYRGTCDNRLFGPTRNPFDTRRNSGGSSGGSAAAVADGILAVAGANDGGGSIRIPSAWCGVFGFQASFGRIPQTVRPNGFDMVSPFIFDGAVARTVEDGAQAAAVLGGYDPADPFSVEDKIDWLGATRRSIKGLKIGFTPNLGIFPLDVDIAACVTSALDAFEQEGAIVEPIKLDIPYDQHELSDLWCRQVAGRMAGAFDGIKAQGLDILKDHRDDLPGPMLDWIARSASMSLEDIHRDQVMRTAIFDAFARAFGKVDLIVCPTVATPPVFNTPGGDTAGPSSIDGEAVDPLIGWCLTYFTNFIGSPSASVPAGLANGLPVGLQIIGRRHGDEDVLAASAAFERAQPWNDIYRRLETRVLR